MGNDFGVRVTLKPITCSDKISFDGFKIIKKEVLLGLKIDAKGENFEQHICIRALKAGNSICEIEGDEPKRIGGERKMKPFATGIELSKQIIQEFIFWKF